MVITNGREESASSGRVTAPRYPPALPFGGDRGEGGGYSFGECHKSESGRGEMNVGTVSLGMTFFVGLLWLCFSSGAELWQAVVAASAAGIFGVLLGMDI